MGNCLFFPKPFNFIVIFIKLYPFQALFRAIGMSPNDYKFGVTKIFFRPGKVSFILLILLLTFEYNMVVTSMNVLSRRGH